MLVLSFIACPDSAQLGYGLPHTGPSEAEAAAGCELRLDEPCRFEHVPGENATTRLVRRTMWKRSCITPILTASQIASGSVVAKSDLKDATPIDKSGHYDLLMWPLSEAGLGTALSSPGGCLVYSFGIASGDRFSDALAARGCHVVAFDPTVNHPRNWKANITFYPWGLRSTVSAERAWSHAQYGNTTGRLFSLPQIFRQLGHDDGRLITAIKFDCEGCEFETFRSLFCEEMARPPIIMHILTEFHFAVTLRMDTPRSIERIRYVAAYLRKGGYTLMATGRHRGALQDRILPADLVAAGLLGDTCCYLAAFVRKDLLAVQPSGVGVNDATSREYRLKTAVLTSKS